MNRLFALLLPVGILATEGPGPKVGPRILEPVAPNDYSRPAGRLDHGILTVALEARLGSWRPDGDSSSAIEVAAFAEEGRTLSAPGPLIRIPEGTEVRATIRNKLNKPLVVYGFGGPKGKQDSLVIQPNAMRSVRFTASRRGTVTYAARRMMERASVKPFEDTQLYGVMIVYPPSGVQAEDEWYYGLNVVTATAHER